MRTISLFALIGVGLLAALPPQAKADEWNKKTVLTFSAPVEIPGQVLSPGTYVFKLADTLSDRNVVEVYNKNQDHLYGTFLAIPDYRMTPTGRTVITFEERAAGAPEAIKAWFYPGSLYGNEFVYPKVKAQELAKTNHQPVPSMPNEMAANTTQATSNMKEQHVMAMKNAPLKAQTETQQEVEIATVFPPQATPPQTEAQVHRPRELPQTASSVPLFGLLGLISLGGAAGLRLATAKMK